MAKILSAVEKATFQEPKYMKEKTKIIWIWLREWLNGNSCDLITFGSFFFLYESLTGEQQDVQNHRKSEGKIPSLH